MTLDELIIKANELRKIFPGDTRIGCWPYDGQVLRDDYFNDVELRAIVDADLYLGYRADPAYKKETIIMLDEV